MRNSWIFAIMAKQFKCRLLFRAGSNQNVRSYWNLSWMVWQPWCMHHPKATRERWSVCWSTRLMWTQWIALVGHPWCVHQTQATRKWWSLCWSTRRMWTQWIVIVAQHWCMRQVKATMSFLKPKKWLVGKQLHAFSSLPASFWSANFVLDSFNQFKLSQHQKIKSMSNISTLESESTTWWWCLLFLRSQWP